MAVMGPLEHETTELLVLLSLTILVTIVTTTIIIIVITIIIIIVITIIILLPAHKAYKSVVEKSP
jgi:hypothetical protein